jgi:hypothetical protein
MQLENAEVFLSVSIAGKQATRGSYDHFHKVNKLGEEMFGVTTTRPVVFHDVKQTVKLSNDFVRGALEEAPSEYNMKRHVWRGLPARKRLMIHVKGYVKAMHPGNRGYTVELL